MKHQPSYRGLVRPITVVCRCGWVHENLRSRGEARRAYDGHLFLASSKQRHVYGIDARRRESA